MLVKTIPNFLQGADNVYRTKHYIVKQRIGVKTDLKENNVMFSHDTYYLRTKERDILYLCIFKDRKNKDGKRLPTTMFARTYVD